MKSYGGDVSEGRYADNITAFCMIRFLYDSLVCERVRFSSILAMAACIRGSRIRHSVFLLSTLLMKQE